MRKFCHGGQFKCPACSDCAAQSLKRRRWLGLVHDTFDNEEIDIIMPFGPVQPRIPNLRLPVGQCLTSRSAITKIVRLAIGRNGGGKTIMVRRDPVDGCIGKPRIGHQHGVHVFFDSLPFGHNGVRHFLRG